MEISKYIRDALQEGSIDKVSKGIEQLVMMMINAIGMIERRELDMEKRLDVLEEDIDLIKSFLLSKPTPVPVSPTPPSPPPISSNVPLKPISTISKPPPLQTSPPSIAPSQAGPNPEIPPTGPTEEDISTFRQKLLKPTPPREKLPPQPLSVRAALMQEVKEYFGDAMNKVKKEKKTSR